MLNANELQKNAVFTTVCQFKGTKTAIYTRSEEKENYI